MPANVAAKIEFLEGEIWSGETWIHDHAKKFPEHAVTSKRSKIAMLEDILSDYTASLEKAKERARLEAEINDGNGIQKNGG